MGAEDIPVVLLRCEIDACMYVVHRAEAHYVLKLIKLEEAKVRRVFCCLCLRYNLIGRIAAATPARQHRELV